MRFRGSGVGAIGIAIFLFVWAAFYWFGGSKEPAYVLAGIGGVVLLLKIFSKK